MNLIEPGNGPLTDPEADPPTIWTAIDPAADGAVVNGYPTYRCKGCGMETSVRPETVTHAHCGGAFVRDMHLLNGLNETAIAQLAGAGITTEQWIKAASAGYVYPEGETPTWTGDRCGCTDDRCIGFHHLDENDCGCLRVLIEQYLTDGSLW